MWLQMFLGIPKKKERKKEKSNSSSLKNFTVFSKWDLGCYKKAQLKTLKNKLISSQNDYKGLLEKFETFANLP